MTSPVYELLKAQIDYLAEQKKRRDQRYLKTIKKSPSWKDQGYIFPGIGGNLRTDCTAIDRIKKKAMLPKSFRPFHGLRHHMAVTLASSGEYTLDMIGELLTHKESR